MGPSGTSIASTQLVLEEDPIDRLLYAGKFAEAGALLRDALEGSEEGSAVRFQLSKLACLLGQFTDAEVVLVEFLKNGGQSPEACGMLAFLLQKKREDHLALQFVDAALESLPSHPLLCQLASELELARGNAARAAHHLQRAAQLEARETVLGVDAFHAGDFSEARRLLEVGLKRQPASLRGLGTYAATLQMQGNLDEACRVLRHALMLQPTSEMTFLQLADLLNRYPKHSEALQCIQAALFLSPESASAHLRMGATLLQVNDPEKALLHLEKAHLLRPDWPASLPLLSNALVHLGCQERAVEVLRKCLHLSPRDSAARSQLIHTLQYLPPADQKVHFAEVAVFADHVEIPLAGSTSLEPTPQKRDPRKIRVGYLSSDFRNHSVALFIEPVFKAHNQERFEIFGYHNRPDRDHVTERLRDLCTHWREVHALSDASLASLVQSDAIDILVDLNNHTAGNRLPAMARIPAPVKVTMIGLMQTTGLRSIHYRISDSFLDPDDSDSPFHSERRIRLKTGPLVFQPPPDAPSCSPLPHLTPASPPFTFGCTNELQKVTPQMIALWSRILRQAPESRFLFFSRKGHTLSRQMQGLGVAPSQLVEVPRAPLREYLEHHARIDLCLDPFPYNGLTVTLLSCWMGVPCITLEGNTPPARAAAAILRRLGLHEYIAQSENEYVEKAVAHSRNPTPLALARQSLRELVRQHFANAESHVRELETAFELMLKARP